MNIREAWVECALKSLDCSRDKLAGILGISSYQFETCMNGDSGEANRDIASKIREFAKIKLLSPALVLWAGSHADAREWNLLICTFEWLAHDGAFDQKTKYPSYYASSQELLASSIVEILTRIGVAPPRAFPAELSLHLKKMWDHPFDVPSKHLQEAFYTSVNANLYAKAIHEVLKTLDALWGYYASCVRTLRISNEDELFSTQMCIEASMVDLAATKIVVDETLAVNMAEFRRKVLADYGVWFSEIRNAISASYSYRVDLMMEMCGIDGRSN